MSKQKRAKESQGYDPNPIIPRCGNCTHLKMDVEFIGTFGYRQEKNVRCGIGEFAVKKMGKCDLHELEKPKTDER